MGCRRLFDVCGHCTYAFASNIPMMYQPLQRHLPKSPLPKRDVSLRAEFTYLSTQLLRLEREQQPQFERIAQIQQELDETKQLLKRIAAGSSNK